MIAKATARHIRISPRKIRYVIDLIRGLTVTKANAILVNLNKETAKPVHKVLDSAVNNAQKKSGIDKTQLYISKIIADGGPIIYRYRAATMGRSATIRKRTSHIKVELDTIEQLKSKGIKKASRITRG